MKKKENKEEKDPKEDSKEENKEDSIKNKKESRDDSKETEEGELEEEVEEAVQTSEFESTPQAVGAITPVLERTNRFQGENLPTRLEAKMEEFQLPTKESKGAGEMYTDEKKWDYDTQGSKEGGEMNYQDNPMVKRETRMREPGVKHQERGLETNQQLQELRQNNPQREDYFIQETRLDNPDSTVAVQDRKIDYKV